MSGAIYFVFSLLALPKSFQSSIGGLLHDSGYAETVREVRDQTLINSETGRYYEMHVCMHVVTHSKIISRCFIV